MCYVAQLVVEASIKSTSLLNWDGVTSKADLLENVRHRVAVYTGKLLLAVEFEDDILTIDSKDAAGEETCLLRYDVITFDEFIGSLGAVGLTGDCVYDLMHLAVM